MSLESIKQEFLPRYLSSGEYKFYKYLLVYALNKLVLKNLEEIENITPELELFEYHEKFLAMYRREGSEEYLEISKIFRRAAHKIYRVMLKQGMTEKSNKFLNLV